jgi:hypothetical protein
MNHYKIILINHYYHNYYFLAKILQLRPFSLFNYLKKKKFFLKEIKKKLINLL